MAFISDSHSPSLQVTAIWTPKNAVGIAQHQHTSVLPGKRLQASGGTREARGQLTAPGTPASGTDALFHRTLFTTSAIPHMTEPQDTQSLPLQQLWPPSLALAAYAPEAARLHGKRRRDTVPPSLSCARRCPDYPRAVIETFLRESHLGAGPCVTPEKQGGRPGSPGAVRAVGTSVSAKSA